MTRFLRFLVKVYVIEEYALRTLLEAAILIRLSDR